MKFFDLIPGAVNSELLKRGVMTDELLYCVKADMNSEGTYYDVYIAFDKNTLYVIEGIESYPKRVKNTLKDADFATQGYSDYALSSIEKMYVDRYQNTARLMLVAKEGDIEKEFSIARFSVGFSEKFEKFTQRVNHTKNNEPIDDTLLEGVKTHCSICGERFPDPNRPVCPKCVDRRSTFKRLRGMFKEFKWQMAIIFLMIIVATVFEIISPIFGSQMLYDDVLNENGKYYGEILMIVLVIVGVKIASTLVRVGSGVINSIIVPKIIHKLRVNTFSAMQKLSVSFFTSKQTGSLMSRVDRDTENIYWFFCDIVPYGVANIVRIVGIAAIMFYMSPILSTGIIGMIVLIHVVQTKFYRSQRKYYRKYDVAMRSANAVLSDVMNGQRVVKSFAKESQEINRFGVKNTEAYVIDTKINGRIANTIPWIWTVCRVLSSLVFCFGAYMVIKGRIAFGVLTALLSYTDMTYEPINFFTWIGDRWAKCMDAASRMFEILDAKPTVQEKEKPIRINNMQGNIELKNVEFEYEAGRPIIKNVSFRVQSGQMFGIVGKTGAGKSTIINLMARLYDVTGGEILIDGINIRDLSIEDLRRNIGIVSQETYLFMGTVAENIKYANPDATMDEVIEAAKSANAHEFITKLQDSYNTKIGEGGVSLSGGERQRISIARAIIQKPNILILDEATASMDTRTERKIQAAIDKLKQGRTIISIAHRLSTLRDADMLCVIENGELKETGTHDELIRSKGKYFELYRLQSDALKFIGIGE